MASKKNIFRNLLNNISKTHSRITPNTKPNISPTTGDSVIRRRFLHKRAFLPPEILVGGNLIEKLKELRFPNNRIRLLDEILPSPENKYSPENSPEVTVVEVKKVMRAAEIENVKSKLREIGENWISYTEFVRICGEDYSDPEQGNRVANMLDQTGNVVVLGKFVCLKPQELTSAMAGLIPTHRHTDNVATKQEFEKLKTIKSEIDKKADDLVRRELQAGLGLIMAQTIGFFRLTFWELSWDVMEPICFYVTSIYFMAGYAFFLRTSREPSFEGFYKSRFETKHNRLVRMIGFDIDRFNELRKIHHQRH
ncbi:unnamed protein product [Cochlearia groenlandica]